MDAKLLRLAPVATALSILLIAAALVMYAADPWRQRGQTWSRVEFMSGETIRLLDSGRYIARNHCDICHFDEAGRWFRRRDAIVLEPDDPLQFQRRAYRARRTDGCVALVQYRSSALVLRREGSQCAPPPSKASAPVRKTAARA